MNIEIEPEEDGRWIAELLDLPGVMAYGQTQTEAVSKAKALALRALADRLEHGEEIAELLGGLAIKRKHFATKSTRFTKMMRS